MFLSIWTCCDLQPFRTAPSSSHRVLKRSALWDTGPSHVQLSSLSVRRTGTSMCGTFWRRPMSPPRPRTSLPPRSHASNPGSCPVSRRWSWCYQHGPRSVCRGRNWQDSSNRSGTRLQFIYPYFRCSLAVQTWRSLTLTWTTGLHHKWPPFGT